MKLTILPGLDLIVVVDYFFQFLPYFAGVTAEDPSSVLSQELSDEDLSVVNMLLAEEVGPELWTDAMFDKKPH